MFLAGIVLVAGGLICGAFLAWQYWGTNIVSKHRQSQTIQALEKGWAQGEPTTTVKFGTAEAIVKIPAFGTDYAIPVFAGTSDSVLAAGFGRFEAGAAPGSVGNYALAAHRVTHGEPLRRMPELQEGDEIQVITRETTYLYELTSAGDALTVDFTAGWVLDPLPRNPQTGGVEPDQEAHQALITLTTCSELFHTDQRLVAFGVLTGSRPTT